MQFVIVMFIFVFYVSEDAMCLKVQIELSQVNIVYDFQHSQVRLYFERVLKTGQAILCF